MVYRIRLLRALLVGGVVGCALPATGHAQAAGGDTTGEIVVTAQKRSENVQDVPAAVSVISPKLLADLHATQLTDVGAYIPAVQIDSAGTPGQTTISIRGIAPIGRGTTVATYIDDSPIGSSSSYGGAIAFQLDLLPYDVDRVEVLRGPQGTLYGASSMGGLLKYVLTEPSLERFQAQVGGDISSVQGASQPGGGVQVKLSGPLVNGVLGATASYAMEDTPGFIDDPAKGLTNQNHVRQQSARLGLLWRSNEDLTVKINGLYQDIKADGVGNVALDPATLKPLVGGLDDNNLTAQPFSKKLGYVAGDISYHTPFADFVSSTSYSDARTSQVQDASYSYGVAFPAFGLPVGASAYTYRLHLKKFTQEVRAQSGNGHRLEWLVGLFYTDEHSQNYQSPSGLDIDGNPIAGFDPLFEGQLPSTYNEYAAFGDLTLNLTHRLQVFGGVRYAVNHQVFSETGDGPLVGTISLLDARSHENVTTYNAGARYKVGDHVTTYVRVASGYRPGGPNLAVPGIPPTFRSDSLTNYEVGLKSQFADHRVTLDLAAFRIDWDDIQLLSNGAGFNHIVNGGTARSQGIEANATVVPLKGLTIDGSFAYIDAKLTEDVPDLGGLDGDRLPDIPRLSGSVRLGYSHEVGGGWTGAGGLGLRIVGNRLSDVSHAYDAFRLPAYAALDSNLSISNARYTVRLFAKNLADKRAYLTYNPLVNQASGAITEIEAAVLQPRTIGLALDAKF